MMLNTMRNLIILVGWPARFGFLDSVRLYPHRLGMHFLAGSGAMPSDFLFARDLCEAAATADHRALPSAGRELWWTREGQVEW